MQTSELLAELEYTDSPNFLGASRFGEALEHAHIFRRAAESFRLHGVYLLREGSEPGKDVSTPVVYVAEAETFEDADEIHRKVWNQNVVPFLLVRTPQGIRLYSGFRYDWKAVPRSEQREQQGVLEAAVAFNEVGRKLSAFHARAIDDGTIWKDCGRQVKSQTRVDWRLLDELEKLGEWLHKGQRLEKDVANALIGKFVYLRYLRDRDILSDRKLREWGIDLRKVFGRNATIDATRDLVERVDDWLNGAIFPFSFSGKRAPRREHIQRVAAIFLGDESSGQLHLDFQRYDFSYIPIETLSVIYEQFLASEGKDKVSGAYYTPIPVVNFMLADLDDHHPLKPGMRVLDPACGSGAFLVQCYRRLIERRLQETPARSLRPAELRDLLVKHIYGVDRDENACRVAALSLVLTMLDYIKPPDLQSTPNFKLPDLYGRNIFYGDFFDPEASRSWASPEKGYDWIIGNPPWKTAEKDDRFALAWIQAHAKICPVVRKQIAEAFAWKAPEHLASFGVVGDPEWSRSRCHRGDGGSGPFRSTARTKPSALSWRPYGDVCSTRRGSGSISTATCTSTGTIEVTCSNRCNESGGHEARRSWTRTRSSRQPWRLKVDNVHSFERGQVSGATRGERSLSAKLREACPRAAGGRVLTVGPIYTERAGGTCHHGFPCPGDTPVHREPGGSFLGGEIRCA